MIRHQNWPLLLEDFLNDSHDQKFEWGQWDCVLFGCAAVEVMTGVDLGAEFRGKYSTEEGAARAIMKAGGNLADAAVRMLGEPLDTPRKAQRGDVGLFETLEGPAIGIVDLSGNHLAAITQESGLIRLPVSNVIKAWRI